MTLNTITLTYGHTHTKTIKVVLTSQIFEYPLSYTFNKYFTFRARNFHDNYAVCNLSTGTSVASSDCSEDLYLDLDGDPDTDLFGDLASSVLNLLQDIKESGNL